VLNGNVTSNGTSFFTGLNTLSNQLTNLDTNLSNINGNLSDLTDTTASSNSKKAMDNIISVNDNKVKVIPNAASPFKLDLSYGIPLDALTPTPNGLISSFVNVLGDYSNSSSLVGGLYTVLQTISNTISTARSNAASFSSNFGTVNSAVIGIKNLTNSIITNINSMDNSIGGAIGIMDNVGQNGNMGLQAFYGVFIGFASLALLGTLLTACCDKYGCRHLVYFSCLIMFLVGLIGALLSTIFSLFIPVFTWGCSFLDVTLGSQTGFTGTNVFK
jgi:hypothetical protein